MIPPHSNRFIARTYIGLENLLAAELQAIGAENTEVSIQEVSFTGNREILYKANYLCRLALNILIPVAEFTAETDEDLYASIKAIPWDSFLTFRDSIAIETILTNSRFVNARYTSLRVKDAIVDWFKVKYSRRPSVDTENPDLSLSLYINGDQCQLVLDSSGEQLWKRGYRKQLGIAPINEVLAAGLISMTGWTGIENFVDPFCGSGTLLIEASMIARNMPGGYFRKRFAFMNWRDYDRNLFDDIKKDARKKLKEQDCEIFGSDISSQLIKAASQNIKNAGFENDITLRTENFLDTSYEGPGVLITSPPFGERMKDEIVQLYKNMGQVMRTAYPGFEAWIITPDLVALKQLGISPEKIIKVFNNGVECRFNQYLLNGQYEEITHPFDETDEDEVHPAF